LVLAQRYDPPIETLWLKNYQARLFLLQGERLTDALKIPLDMQQYVSLFYPASIHIVTQARALLAQRRSDEAIRLLTALLAKPRDLLTVEAFGLLALARQAQGDSVHALLALEQALVLAETERRVRAILDLSMSAIKLLTQFLEEHPNHHFAHGLLQLFPQTMGSQTPAALSEREIEILRLIAAGSSNEEIAAALVLALSTVKWYINSLYAKLHVKTRAQAIARAHALRLLD
jgi:LuxR family transcriptional regulator, maltose regulon positive regulatory protein